MATARRSLDEALHSVQGLRALPEHARDEAEERAWEQLRQALREARMQPLALSCVPEGEAAATLRFLAAWAAKRRVLRAKVAEGLRVLFGDAGWLRAARGDAELLASLESLFPVPERPLPARAGPGPGGVPAEGGGCQQQAPAPEDPALRQEVRGALELLASALGALRRLDWAFPPESSQNADRDGAVDAFRSLFLGISRLSAAARRAGTDRARRGRVALALDAHSADWPGVLRFLADLHRHRRVFSSQVSSVVAKLTELSPAFEDVLKKSPEGELFGAAAAGTAPEPAAAAASRATEASPPAAALPERARAERAVFEGSRVEALYEGRWYGGTVVAVPAEDPEGRWIVQCDTDEPGVLTYAKSVSSRVEAFYEGEWYRGSVVSVPSEDPEGRWAVQCDADPHGTVTYTTIIRPAPAEVAPAETGAQDPKAEPQRKTPAR
uniref:Uncharacterized protein n=1 Tax=Alexandrium monilatum TaxID=311494 RepID=A0A6T1NII8_9DINO